MSDASSDDASSMSGDDGSCDGCGSWGLTPDSAGSGFNICQMCGGNFCNYCSIMCPGGCDQEFCSDCARTSLVHHIPNGRMLHMDLEGREGGYELGHNHNADFAEDMYSGILPPFCSVKCVQTFSMRHAQAVYESKVNSGANDPTLDAAQWTALMNLNKWAIMSKFLFRLGFFDKTKRMAAAEAMYKPGGKGHKRSRDEFE